MLLEKSAPEDAEPGSWPDFFRARSRVPDTMASGIGRRRVTYNKAGHPWSAYFYYETAIYLLLPADFVDSNNFDKLIQEVTRGHSRWIAGRATDVRQCRWHTGCMSPIFIPTAPSADSIWLSATRLLTSAIRRGQNQKRRADEGAAGPSSGVEGSLSRDVGLCQRTQPAAVFPGVSRCLRSQPSPEYRTLAAVIGRSGDLALEV